MPFDLKMLEEEFGYLGFESGGKDGDMGLHISNVLPHFSPCG